MKILLATSECDPFAKVGGLGDVIPALATELKKLGHDIRIVLPKYGSINLNNNNMLNQQNFLSHLVYLEGKYNISQLESYKHLFYRI